MTIEDIMSRPGCWLGESGPLSDIVISSRIRLARNVAGYPFLSRATHSQRKDLAGFLSERLEASSFRSGLSYIDVDKLDELSCQVLVERHLVSRQLVEAKGARGVSVSDSQNAVVMVNEEDHLRMHVVGPGMQLDDLWDAVDELDDSIESEVDYAFHPRFGYLTACPTNVGSGIRVSVMLHLPALKLTGEIERVLRAAKDMNLAVRGLFGEGTEATGTSSRSATRSRWVAPKRKSSASFAPRSFPASSNTSEWPGRRCSTRSPAPSTIGSSVPMARCGTREPSAARRRSFTCHTCASASTSDASRTSP